MIRNLAVCGVAAVLSIFAAGCVAPSSDDSLNTAPDKQALSHGKDKEGGKKKKITICHVPPGNPANAHSITIDKSALGAHLAHGDNIGKCQNDDDDDDDGGDHDGGGDHDDGGGCGGGNGGAGGGTTSTTTSTTTNTGTGTGLGGGGGVGGSTDTGTTSVTDTGAGGSTGSTDTGGAGGSTDTFTITGTDSGTITETATDSGTTTTSNVCNSDGLACGSNADCCSGLCGGSGICTSTCTQGPEAGDAFCAQDLDCCSGVCLWGNCMADMTCYLPGNACDGNADCCFGLVCTDGACQ